MRPIFPAVRRVSEPFTRIVGLGSTAGVNVGMGFSRSNWNGFTMGNFVGSMVAGLLLRGGEKRNEEQKEEDGGYIWVDGVVIRGNRERVVS